MRPTHPPPAADASLGALTRFARLRRGWSQDELSRRAGVALRTINRIEQEGYGHRLNTWQRVATGLELPALNPRLAPMAAVRELLLRDLQQRAVRPPPPAPDARHIPERARSHVATQEVSDAVTPLPDVEALIGQLEDTIATLTVVRDSVAAYAGVVEEIERLRARMQKLTAIVFDHPEE